MNKKFTIKDSTFNGVVWGAKATKAVVIAAKALLNITELFKSQNITLESMVKIESENLPSGKSKRK